MRNLHGNRADCIYDVPPVCSAQWTQTDWDNRCQNSDHKPKSERRRLALEKHYANCAALVALCGGTKTGKRASTILFHAERQAHDAMIRLCNDSTLIYDELDRIKGAVRLRVIEALGSLPPGFFINQDPRGYALKLEANSVDIPFERDWGGYQILSPEIEGN
jgi:hypothetical protein